MWGTDLVNKKGPRNHKHNLSGLFLYALLQILCSICLFPLVEAYYSINTLLLTMLPTVEGRG